MTKPYHMELDEYWTWLCNEEIKYRLNPQAARTFKECREKLEQIFNLWNQR